MAAKHNQKKRTAASDSVEREGVKKRKASGDVEATVPARSTSHSSPNHNQPSTSKPAPKQTPEAAVKIHTGIPVTGKNKLTRQLFDQIPFLEMDPLKALEMLKKMVQESGLETLYMSVNENAARSKDFSDRILELKKNIENTLKFMLNGRASEQEKIEKYKEMKTIWSKIHGLNEAKVKLTQGAYDMVDRVIRRLDKELESIISEIGHGKMSTMDKGPRSSGLANPGPGGIRMRGADFDMPVDPNEPTYCECKQISYGEMIACDNINCPVEWFHFSCVNLSSKPKGKWFCKRCVASGQNKQGKKKKNRVGIIEKYASQSDKSEVELLNTGSESE